MAREWVALGRLLQQMVHSDLPTVDVIQALVRLLCRVTDEVPANDAELRKVLHALFQRLEFEPQLVQTLAAMIDQGEDGTEEQGSASAAKESAQQNRIEVHIRVKAIIVELIPSFRNLRTKLMPKEAEPQLVPHLGRTDDGSWQVPHHRKHRDSPTCGGWTLLTLMVSPSRSRFGVRGTTAAATGVSASGAAAHPLQWKRTHLTSWKFFSGQVWVILKRPRLTPSRRLLSASMQMQTEMAAPFCTGTLRLPTTETAPSFLLH